ncbi:MAG: 4Fe-4S dicluster domain-containing protein [Chloroflexota bacterium]|nr:MAG: 4Fe-4S dicluster domain-containing protein [Chloroflexota bacterium]
MGKILAIDQSKCTACRMCELACSMKTTGEFNPATSRIQLSIFDDDAFYLPVVCTQCDEAWCAEVCPSTAIRRDESVGALVVDNARCIGCRMCTMACPFGTIMYDSKQGKAIKCDNCNGEPECIPFCPTGAIRYEAVDASGAKKRKALAKQMMAAREVKA